MQTRKKILFFIISVSDGGAERALINLLKALDKTKYEITLRTIIAGGARESDIPDNVIYRPIIRTQNKLLKKFLRKVLMSPILSKIVYRVFIDSDHDVEVAYLQGIPTYIIQSCKKKCKKIAYVHTAISEEFVKNILKVYKSKKRINEKYAKMDMVSFVSESAKTEFENYFGYIPHSCVAHNIIDVDAILQNSTKKTDVPYNKEQLSIVSCGRIVPIKGLDRILRSVKDLDIDSCLYRVYIIGDGSEKGKYCAFIKENHLENIAVLSYKENIYPYIKNADLYVCSSISESYGMSIVEALVIGVPILTTSLPSLEDILSNGYKESVMIVDNSFEGVKRGLEVFLSSAELRAEMKDAATKNAVFYREKFAGYYSENERLFCCDD